MSKKQHLKKQFFIVFSPEGLAPPKIVHPTHKAALYAAVQMAKLNPDASFYVMGSMSGAVKPREEAPVIKETEEPDHASA